MTRSAIARTRPVRFVLAVLMVVALAGCVTIPTGGPIEKVLGDQASCQNCVNVEVTPPTPGDDPRQIVEGYLRATSNYQPNYSVARQFLSPTASEKWSPETGVSIYRGSPEADGSSVTLDGQLVGSLAADRSYVARDEDLKLDFGLVKVNGEWRIGNPPPGLLVTEFSFASFYQAYELYFIGNGSALVPDPIYLPKLRSPANVTSALMKALLNGPSKWLAPAVETALPPGTTLSVDSVPLKDGIADVPLSDSVLALSDADRSLMAAQVVYTLKQVVGVKGVLFTVNQQPFRVPESDPTSLAVSVDAIVPERDPIPFAAAEQLYVVSKGTVRRVTGPDQTTLEPVAGWLGEGGDTPSSLAVSVTNTDLAVVSSDRTVLRRGPISAEGSAVLVEGAEQLLRPQFTRYNEVWDIGKRARRQQIWMFPANPKTKVQVDASAVLDGGEIVAFKISPDASRIALIRRTKDRYTLGLGRISRPDAGRVIVDGWRPLNTTQANKPRVTRMADVGWLDPTTLIVLGADSASASLAPIELSQDASEIVSQTPANNDAVQVTVLLRTQAALILGKDHQTYKDDGNRWQPFLANIDSIAYPG